MNASDASTTDALTLALLGWLHHRYEQQDDAKVVALHELVAYTGAKTDIVKKRLQKLRELKLLQVVERQHPKGYQYEPFAVQERHWLSTNEEALQETYLEALADWTTDTPLDLPKKWRR